MFCINCGTELPENARFCRSCGAPQTMDAGAGFQQPQAAAPVMPQRQAPTGALLLEAGKMTRYNGDKAVGVVTGTGDLYIYDDRLEFYKKTGDQRGYMLGPVLGAALTMNDAKKNPVDIYELRDIRGVRTGKYAGLMGTLILELKNGKAVSFVPASKKAGAAEMCELIRQYL